MDTHGQENKAAPPRDSSSFFRGGTISQGETQADNRVQNNQAANPYRFARTSREETTNEQHDFTSAEQPAGLFKQIKDKLFREKPGVSNTRQKIMVILIPVLFIVMIFMFRQVLSKAPQETEGAVEDTTGFDQAGAGNEIDWQIPEPISMNIRDPIKPAPQTPVTNTWKTDANNTGILNVRGILYSQDKPSAVVNNRIVHLNDKIDDVTIVEIDREYVIFERNGKRWTRKVAEPDKDQQEQQYPEQEQQEQDMQTGEIQS
ncbi:MAG: hypothetical protein JW715_17040 [Sedimentisphaerales bacterium]|nr:hypothetical protein [Sedimentisphaerales bacterium]